MERKITKVLNFPKEEREFDFTGNRLSMFQGRITKRFIPTNTNNIDEYYQYLLENRLELDNLIDILAINVSSFFRNPLVFEHLS